MGLMGVVKTTSVVRMRTRFRMGTPVEELSLTAWGDASLSAPKSITGVFMEITSDDFETFLPKRSRFLGNIFFHYFFYTLIRVLGFTI